MKMAVAKDNDSTHQHCAQQRQHCAQHEEAHQGHQELEESLHPTSEDKQMRLQLV